MYSFTGDREKTMIIFFCTFKMYGWTYLLDGITVDNDVGVLVGVLIGCCVDVGSLDGKVSIS
jgi:hypothetical protein